MKRLSFKDVKEMRKLEEENQLQPYSFTRNYYNEYSYLDIFRAHVILRLAFTDNKNSSKLAKKLYFRRMINSNNILSEINSREKIIDMETNKFINLLEQGNSLQIGECFYNALIIAVNAINLGKDDVKIVSGTITCPVCDEQTDDLTRLTATHAVAQIGDNVYDYNYGVILNKNEYDKLFAFDRICEITQEKLEIIKNTLIIEAREPLTKDEYFNSIYLTLAPDEYMQHFYNINMDKKLNKTQDNQSEPTR